jgi:hypothetical protein
MAETAELNAEARTWSLAALADEAEFDSRVEMAATAIADRFTLQSHINIGERRHAYYDWIDRVRSERRPVDHTTFVSVCSAMVQTLATRRVATYSAMIRDPGDDMADVVLRYGNEVTALVTGASVYAVMISDLTGTTVAAPLPALVMENAAAALRRRPEAAASFRELMMMPTQWT